MQNSLLKLLAAGLTLAFCCVAIPAVAFAHDGDGKDLSNASPGGSGSNGPHAYSGVALRAQLKLADMGGGGNVLANDIWGWQDASSGRKFAIVGLTNATSFVEVTDRNNPIYLGKMNTHEAGQNRSWRDVKVYQDHAYIVADGSGNDQGIQVMDLKQLLTIETGSDPVIFDETHHYAGFSRAHNFVINEQTGYGYAVGAYDNSGSRLHRGGLAIFDLSDPGNITEVGSYRGDGYTHDAQAVIYQGPDSAYVGREVVFASNEDTLTIVDVTDKANTALISRNPYADANYSHQGWLSEDQRFFYMNDELDEYNHARGPDGTFGTDDDGDPIPTKTHIWNVEDLDNPDYVGFYEGTEETIDHNLYVKDGLIYQANYTSGLRILKEVDPANGILEEVRFFDTYATDNNVTFNGAWSVYPYFDDMILVSDRQGGLFIVSVPEPSSTLVVGLGLLTLVMRRRRK